MNTFTVLSWNINGYNHFGKTPIKKVIAFLKKHESDVLCLQECLPNDDRQALLQALKKQYPYVAAITTDTRSDEYNNNVVLSKFPIVDYGELMFEGLFFVKAFENVTWCEITVGHKTVRLYDCHLRIVGGGIAERTIQLKRILSHANKSKHPIIVCGDMNTTIVEKGIRRRIIQLFHIESTSSMVVDGKYIGCDERYYFAGLAKKYGFVEALDLRKTTWATPPLKIELFNLKLDWFLTKRVVVKKAILGDYISDHRPILATCSVAK